MRSIEEIEKQIRVLEEGRRRLLRGTLAWRMYDCELRTLKWVLTDSMERKNDYTREQN